MGVDAYSDLRDKARQEAGDVSGNRWPDAELDRYIEAGQREYALLRMELRDSVRVESLGESVFTAPSNYITAYRFTDDSGVDLPFYSFRQLSDDYTPKFLTDNVGSPVMACFNFDNWNQFRFYPMLASGTAGTLFYFRYPEDENMEINEDALLYYVWWRMYLREWDAEYLKKSVYYRKLFKTELYRGDRNRSITLPYVATIPAFNDIRTALRELLQDTDGQIWDNGRLDAYLNEAQTQYVKRSGCLKKTVDMVPDAAGAFYFPSDFIDFSYAWNVNDLEIKTILEKKMRAAYGSACDTETGIPELIYDGFSGREYKLFPAPGDASELATADSEPGCIVQMDGAVFDQEEGAVVYCDAGPMDGEAGGCNAIFEYSGDTGKLHYVRAPHKGMIEIRNPDALLWYAGAKCFEEDREMKDLNKAAALRQAFTECLNIENVTNHKQTGHRITGRFK